MLALCVGWNGRALDVSVAARLAQASEAGTGRRARTHRCDEAIVATTLAPVACMVRDGRTVFFHGVIQNHRELRRELHVAENDAAALYAAALSRWGDDADAHVLGEYAAVSIESPGPVLRLVRSPISAPPLRYHRSDDLLVVASIARVIHATGAVDAVVDEQKIADSLYLNYAAAERDWFHGICRVRVGETVVHTPDAVRARRYYDLGALPPVRLRADADMSRQLPPCLRKAPVRRWPGGRGRPSRSAAVSIRRRSPWKRSPRCHPARRCWR